MKLLIRKIGAWWVVIDPLLGYASPFTTFHTTWLKAHLSTQTHPTSPTPGRLPQ